MPDIHIHREHHLGFQEARKVGVSWAEKAEKKFDMDCSYEEGDTQDTLYFSRAGVKGTLLVDAHQFVVCGISFGLADTAHAANGFRTQRAAPGDSVTWRD